MTLELTTNGWICGYNHAGYRHIVLGRCLDGCVSNGPIIMYEHGIGWEAHSIKPDSSIPRSAIQEEYRVIREPHSIFPEIGVVYVLNQEPKLRSPPVAEHASEDRITTSPTEQPGV